MTTVELVVAGNVEYGAREGILGPLDATRFDVDIARQNDDVSVADFRLEQVELVVQVGQQMNAH